MVGSANALGYGIVTLTSGTLQAGIAAATLSNIVNIGGIVTLAGLSGNVLTLAGLTTVTVASTLVVNGSAVISGALPPAAQF